MNQGSEAIRFLSGVEKEGGVESPRLVALAAMIVKYGRDILMVGGLLSVSAASS